MVQRACSTAQPVVRFVRLESGMVEAEPRVNRTPREMTEREKRIANIDFVTLISMRRVLQVSEGVKTALLYIRRGRDTSNILSID